MEFTGNYICVCLVFNLSLLVGGPMVIKPMAKPLAGFTLTPRTCGWCDFEKRSSLLARNLLKSVKYMWLSN